MNNSGVAINTVARLWTGLEDSGAPLPVATKVSLFSTIFGLTLGLHAFYSTELFPRGWDMNLSPTEFKKCFIVPPQSKCFIGVILK